MEIVDAQVHIWSAGTPSQDHIPDSAFTAERLLAGMDAAGVHRALIHPPGWDPDCEAVAEAAVRAHPERFAILGSFPPTAPQSRSLVATWLQRPGMLGLRWAPLHPQARELFLSGAMDWIWPEAQRYDVPVALLAGPVLGKFRTIAECHPGLRLIIDHCGLVRLKQDAAAFEHLEHLLALARLPNVAIKATGAPGYSTEPYPYRNLHDGLRRIFDAFGPDRFFWGTDITRMPCSYRECVTLFTEELPWLQGHLDQVMGGGIRAWLNWKSLGD
jgi:predicted TIM-barrel fold metal-dependent hydrolase